MRMMIFKVGAALVAVSLNCGIALANSQGPATATKSAQIESGTKDKNGVIRTKPVDINHASKSELKTLPGVGDVEAARIIAGRPYGSKAYLVTKGIILRGLYEGVKNQVIAGQGK